MQYRNLAQLVEAPKPKQLQSRRGAAKFIAEMALQLRNIAKDVRLLELQGLLEVTYYEAFEVANMPEMQDEEREYLTELAGEARKTGRGRRT
jgi:hypothetical protein